MVAPHTAPSRRPPPRLTAQAGRSSAEKHPPGAPAESLFARIVRVDGPAATYQAIALLACGGLGLLYLLLVLPGWGASIRDLPSALAWPMLARDRPQEFPGLMPILAVGEMVIPLRDFDDQEFATDRRLARLAVEIMPWGLPLQMWLHKLGSPVGELEAIRLLLPAMQTVSNVHQHKGTSHRDID